ncbi:MAG: hypothetical protein KME06_05630 [Kastovskya adunca ATA6-11-RM4]|jgi:hypothetical protein|nr:hypothetical protein [Kastovskya adunca ATA6-11-RM4]
MREKLIWQQGSRNAENATHFTVIQEWWANLKNTEITWRQRLIPQSGNLSELNWEPQRFDETFKIQNPQIRGITLYWSKPGEERERSTTPYQMVLDSDRQLLYIFPQSQKELVIQVALPQVPYETIELKNPQIQGTSTGENHILTFRDASQQLEVKITLTPIELGQLKEQLPD